MPNQSQKPVDIGGQAVLEGVMMKGPDAIAITVRRPDKTMVVDYKKSEPLSKKHKWMGLPIIRGAVNMVNMLVMGMTTLETSAKMLGTEEEEPTKFEKWLAAKLGKSIDKVVMGVAMVLAVLLSVGLFIVLPSLAEKGMLSLGASDAHRRLDESADSDCVHDFLRHGAGCAPHVPVPRCGTQDCLLP